MRLSEPAKPFVSQYLGGDAYRLRAYGTNARKRPTTSPCKVLTGGSA